MERRPIGLLVGILALLLAGGACLLLDSPSSGGPAALAGVAPVLGTAPAEGKQAGDREEESSAAPRSDVAPVGSSEAPRSGPVATPATPQAEAAEIPRAEAAEIPRAEAAGTPREAAETPAATAAPAPSTDGEAPPALVAPSPASPQPLGNLAPAVVRLIERPPNEISVAAIDLRRGLTFAHDANAYYDLASLAKVPLMLTLLEALDAEQRDPNELEQTLLELMIHWSDNQAATAIWHRVGDGAERALMQALDLWPRLLFVGEGWGGVEGSAMGVAQLFREIVAGDQLPAAVRQAALDLIDGVSHVQRWGLSAGIAEESGASVGLKNGWYPTDSGWFVHSAGYVLDASGEPDYILAILSADHARLADGIETVEAIAIALHAALRPSLTAGVLGTTR